MIFEEYTDISCEAHKTVGCLKTFKYVCFKKNNVGMDEVKCAGISIYIRGVTLKYQNSKLGKS